jgi:hypothetical protein
MLDKTRSGEVGKNEYIPYAIPSRRSTTEWYEEMKALKAHAVAQTNQGAKDGHGDEVPPPADLAPAVQRAHGSRTPVQTTVWVAPHAHAPGTMAGAMDQTTCT